MTELTLKLIIILIPGGLGTLIISKLIVHKEWTPFRFIINSILVGLFSYLLLQLLINLFSITKYACHIRPAYNFKALEIWYSISNSKIIPYNEVIGASICGVLLGYIISWFDHHKVINKIAHKLNMSSKYGDENLFTYFMNAKETQIVYIRHFKNKLTYYGYVKSYSENDSISEIVLSNVKVYKYEDSSYLYEVDQIYLSFNKEDIIIEQSKLNEHGQEIKSGQAEKIN